ncbi:MAG: chaperone NapD [Gammaproteobacteria bacterium]|nr:chaperone NapD [Gammaproteobacteria bacterium]
MNISGVLVYAQADKADTVSQMLSEFDGVEVHASEQGKLIVTIEDENTGALADRVIQFQDLPNILSVAVVYHHDEANDDELIDPVTIPSCDCNEFNPLEAP